MFLPNEIDEFVISIFHNQDADNKYKFDGVKTLGSNGYTSIWYLRALHRLRVKGYNEQVK